MHIKRKKLLRYPFLLCLIWFFVENLYSDEISFEDLWNSKELLTDIPDVPLETKELEALYRGEIIYRVLPGDYELPAVWTRYIVEADPVTVWWIWNDLDHFSLEYPSYPKSGSLLNPRHKFWPHIFDSYTCKVNNVLYQYQLLVPPLVSPRKTMLKIEQDLQGFPWQKMETGTDKFYCKEKTNPEFKKLGEKAIWTKKNEVISLIGPISKELRKKPKDIFRTQIIYFIQGNPGGIIEKLIPLINKAQSIAKSIVMPAGVEAIRFHISNWDKHMTKYHTTEENAEYNDLLKRYLEYYGE